MRGCKEGASGLNHITLLLLQAEEFKLMQDTAMPRLTVWWTDREDRRLKKAKTTGEAAKFQLTSSLNGTLNPAGEIAKPGSRIGGRLDFLSGR